ncbi:hypothetical protein [Paenibacillus sinopodophylli]|uniref:hypothetical protein n=1 Tax=Paenibacillus sinopodophylli TaxID=1837342 RepID=UPI00110C9253|nr:hypothetical protein [Paenibacillus sinopodophylli]
MSYITILFIISIAAIVGAGYKFLIKKGLYRNFVAYSVMTLWAAYLFSSQWYDWPIITLVTPVTLLFAPLKRFLNMMSWMS